MKDLLALDPGIEALAAVLFEDKVIVRAGLAKAAKVRLPLGALCNAQWSMIETVLNGLKPEVIVVERMQHYGKQTKVDPNDLLDLQAIGAYCAGRTGSGMFYMYPSEWKGQLPKTVVQTRIQKILSADEITALGLERWAPGLHHNLWDAAAMGLKVLGRF